MKNWLISKADETLGKIGVSTGDTRRNLATIAASTVYFLGTVVIARTIGFKRSAVTSGILVGGIAARHVLSDVACGVALMGSPAIKKGADVTFSGFQRGIVNRSSLHHVELILPNNGPNKTRDVLLIPNSKAYKSSIILHDFI